MSFQTAVFVLSRHCDGISWRYFERTSDEYLRGDCCAERELPTSGLHSGSQPLLLGLKSGVLVVITNGFNCIIIAVDIYVACCYTLW